MCLLSPTGRQNTYAGTTLTHTSTLSQIWITTLTLWEEVNTKFKYGESCLKPQALFAVSRDNATLILSLKCRKGWRGRGRDRITNGF